MKMIKSLFAVVVAGLLAGDGFGMTWEKLISVSPEILPTLYKGTPFSCPLKAYRYDLETDRHIEVAASWQWANIQCTGLSACSYSPKPGNAVSVMDYCRVGDEDDIPFDLDQPMTIDGHRFDQVLISPDYLDFVNSQDDDEYWSLSFGLTYDEDYSSGFRDVWYSYDASKGTMTFYWRYESSVSGEEYNISACLTPKDGRIDFKCDKISNIDCVWLDFWTSDGFDSYEGSVPDGSTGSAGISFGPGDVPSWLSLSSAGVLSGTPPAEMDRPIAIVGSVKIDGELAHQLFTYDLHVVDPANLPPQIVSTDPVEGYGTYYDEAQLEFSVNAISPDGGPLTYAWYCLTGEGRPPIELTPETLAAANAEARAMLGIDYDIYEVDGNRLIYREAQKIIGARVEFRCVVSNRNGSVSRDLTYECAIPPDYPEILSLSPPYGQFAWYKPTQDKTLSVNAISPNGSKLTYEWNFGMHKGASEEVEYRTLTPANLASINADYRNRLQVDHDLITVNGASLTLSKDFPDGRNLYFLCRVSNDRGTVEGRFYTPGSGTAPKSRPSIRRTASSNSMASIRSCCA